MLLYGKMAQEKKGGTKVAQLDQIVDFVFLLKLGKLLVRKSAGGENRTRTGLIPPDFESGASTNSTTPA